MADGVVGKVNVTSSSGPPVTPLARGPLYMSVLCSPFIQLNHLHLQISAKITSFREDLPGVSHCPQALSFLHSEKVKVLIAQSCPTLCNPMDCSPSGSSVHGILQARILEWLAIPFSRGSSQPRDLPHCRQILCHLSHQGSLRVCYHCVLTGQWLFPHLDCKSALSMQQGAQQVGRTERMGSE